MKYVLVKIGFLGAILCSLLLAACSTNTDYLQAKSLPVITIPEDLDNEAVGEIYSVPDNDQRLEPTDSIDALPPVFFKNFTIAEPKIQKLGKQAWLVVPGRASATWSQLRLYLQSRGIKTINQDVYNASMQTAWITDVAGSDAALRYRIHLEAGIQPSLTEIHLTNIQGTPTQTAKPLLQWAKYSDNFEHELQLLQDISQAFSRQRLRGDSLIASAVSLPDKVQLVRFEAEPVLEFNTPKNIAYQVLLNHLKTDDIALYEHNPKAGVLYFNYKKQVKEKAFFGKVVSLFNIFDGDEDNNTGQILPLPQVLSNLPNEPAVKQLFADNTQFISADSSVAVAGYLLVQRTLSDNKQRFFIRDGSGRPLAAPKAQAILEAIKLQLL